jgi:hypothetical protein
LGEPVAGTIQPALDGPKIAPGNFRDFLVRLSLHLSKNEDGAVVLG